MKLSSTKGLIYLLLFTFGVIYVSSEAPEYSLDYDRYIFFHWKGALTSHSLLLRVFPHISELNDYNYDAYIVLNYKKRPAKTPSVVRIPFRKGDNPLSKLTLEPLKPHTTYKYGFIFVNKESNLTSKELGKIFNSNPHQEFTFTTLGLALTPFNFTFGAASCAQTGSVNDIFLSMHQANLNFFIHMGDMHYMNIVDNVTQEFDQAYYDVFSSPTQQVFFQGTPLFYVFDDHDFGKNDATGNSPSRYSANSAYRDFVPHSTLKNRLPRDDSAIFKRAPAAEQRNQSEYVTIPAADPNYGVFQSFIVGRCLFIMMDLRTFKDRNPGDILGDEQTAWLENQIRFAGYTSEIVQVFIVSSFSWIHNDTGSEWVPYPEVQQTIAGWINEHIVGKGKKMMMLSGDAHMVAFDDGTNNRFGGFSVVQAASLDQSPSCKGGPYSHGVSPGRGQYGNINVIDYGNDTICVQVSLRNVEGALISYNTCEPDKYPQNEMSCHEWHRH